MAEQFGQPADLIEPPVPTGTAIGEQGMVSATVLTPEQMAEDRRLGPNESIVHEGGSFRDTSLPDPILDAPFTEEQGHGSFQRFQEIHRRKREARIRNRGFAIRQILGKEEFDERRGLNENIPELDLRRDLARSDRVSEKVKKFKKHFPKGTIRRLSLGKLLDGKDIFIFKRNADEPWQQLDPPYLDAAGEMADIEGAIVNFQMLFGTIGAISPFPGGTFVGALAGDLIDQQIESLRGFQDDTFRQQVGKSSIDAAIFQFINTGIYGVEKTLRAARGGALASMFQQKGGASGLVAGAEREGLNPLVAGQTARNPTVRGAFTQAGGTSPVPKEVAERQAGSLRELARKQSEKVDVRTLDEGNLLRLVDQHQRALDKVITNPNVTPGVALSVLRKEGARFERSSLEWVSRKYDKASKAGRNVFFKTNQLLENIKNIKQGVLSRDSAGKEYRISSAPGTESSKLMNDILILPERVGRIRAQGKETAAKDQILALRTRAVNLMNSKGSEGLFGRQIYAAISETLDNPQGGGAAFKKLWQSATFSNKWRDKVLSERFMKRSLTVDDGGEFMKNFAQPGRFFSLQLMKRILPPERFKIVGEHVKTRILQSGDINASLKGWAKDPRELDLIMSKADQKALAEAGKMEKQFNEGPVKAMLAADEGNAINIQKMLSSKVSARDAKRMILASPGGRNSQMALSVKSGIFKKFLEEAEEESVELGIRVLNPTKLLASINKLEKSRKLDFLYTKADWKRLRNIQSYSVAIKDTIDVGGAIQAGEARAGVTSVNPLKWIKAYHTIGSNAITARILASEVSHKAIAASPKTLTNEKALRAFGVASAIALSQMAGQERVLVSEPKPE